MSRSTETARMPTTPRCSRINGDVSPPAASSTPSRTERTNAIILPSCFSPTTIPSSSSCCDSRIPRPSSCVALRRSSSMRVRGERVPCTGGGAGCHPPPTTPTELGTLLRQQHRRQNNLPQQQQQQQQATPPPPHRYPDHRIFPVITENGTDSPRQRSFSLSLTPARPRAGRAASGGSSSGVADADSDAESVKSYGSACSTASACDHATFALNGTTWSGRSRKYVVHCSNHNGDNEQYLTPTQRAARQVRKFQALLKEARKEIEEKDREIFRLTKELVELRLYKASLNSPDERTDSSDALTVRENNPFSPDSPSKELPNEEAAGSAAAEPAAAQPKPPSPEDETPEKQPVQPDLPSSLADSGHFEDGSIHSKDSVYLPERTVHLLLGNVASRNEGEGSVDPGTSTGSDTVDHRQTDRCPDARSPSSASFPRSNVETPDGEVAREEEEEEEQRRKLASLYENRRTIEEMHRRHIDEIQELKEKHNDKVESLLNQLADVNTRYCEVRPAVDVAEAKVRELETELEAVKAELAEKKTLLEDQEERNKQMYLKMYAKGQEAARLEQADHHQIYGQSQSKSSVTDLLRQLTVTQAELDNVKAMYRRIVEARSSQGALDPEITLQFLKSAIYYFLTDRENHQGHLNAIESILGFTEAEKRNIDKIYRSARK